MSSAQKLSSTAKQPRQLLALRLSFAMVGPSRMDGENNQERRRRDPIASQRPSTHTRRATRPPVAHACPGEVLEYASLPMPERWNAFVVPGVSAVLGGVVGALLTVTLTR